MITISFLGLDQFVVGHYSTENSSNIASLFETDENLLNFYAPSAMVFHHGVEQTSWNLIVQVRAPIRFKPLEARVADYLLKSLSEYSINIELEFEYFEEASHYEKINDSYPRYIDSDKPLDVHEDDHDEDEEDGEEEADPRDRADLDPNDPNQIYLGNAFEGFEKKLAEKQGQEDKPAGKKPGEK